MVMAVWQASRKMLSRANIQWGCILCCRNTSLTCRRHTNRQSKGKQQADQFWLALCQLAARTSGFPSGGCKKKPPTTTAVTNNSLSVCPKYVNAHCETCVLPLSSTYIEAHVGNWNSSTNSESQPLHPSSSDMSQWTDFPTTDTSIVTLFSVSSL